MKWFEIGLTRSKSNREFEIQVHSEYEKALLKLNLFSHVLLFFLEQNQISLYVAKLLHLDQSNGTFTVELIRNNAKLQGQLVDIKPYFPNEEVVLDVNDRIDTPTDELILVPYRNKSIGEYKVFGHTSYIQLDQEDGRIKHKENVYAQIKSGDYVRILWWFHRFDKDSFRKNRMCNPPYNKAPKTGIFASRSPVRPNPLASTIVQVSCVDVINNQIEVIGFDGFPGSIILQVMKYDPSFERLSDVSLPPWVAHWTPYKSFEPVKSLDNIQLENLVQETKAVTDEHPDLLVLESEEDMYFHDQIHIKNAFIHNLKNISVSIPKNEITLISGVSGSGKSSLAFDTLYAESQKQFMDLVLSGQIESNALGDTKVEKISGLQPAIAIKQKNLGANPRSTVGSSTRIADLVKLLYSVVGVRLCPMCHKVVDTSNVCSCGHILFDRSPQAFSYNHPDYMCPICKGLGVEMQIDSDLIVEDPEKSLLDKASSLYGDMRKHQKKPNANWMRGEVLALALDMGVDLNVAYKDLPESFKKQFLYGSQGREVSLAYENSKGRSGVITRPAEGAIHLIERLMRDSKSSSSADNIQRFLSKKTCTRCGGERLVEESRLVHVQGTRYPQVMQLSVEDLKIWCHQTYNQMDEVDKSKTRAILKKLVSRLSRIQDVGLSYISLDRSIPTLSGGEAQRLKLATQFGTGLTDILYILDEPSKGLHPKDYKFLMEAIEDLKLQGNTVVVVEHKESFKQIADYHIVMGPKAGQYGGEIVETFEKTHIKSSPYVDDLLLEQDSNMGMVDKWIVLKGVSTHNLKSVEVNIPLGKMTGVIGVSGSGKSSLISQTLYPYLLKHLGRSVDEMGKYQSIDGIQSIVDMSFVSQKPIGSNSRSTPGTYTGVFDNIRKCYSKLDTALANKFGKEHFSFNSKKGQCEVCKGLGEVAVNMHYMDDLYVACSACKGQRYNQEVLSIKRQGYSIGDLLEMEITDLIPLFQDEIVIHGQLCMLEKVGLGYVKLGQSASTLSGGEAQRIKLAKELYRKSCEGVLYILDEPTTGLHPSDTKRITEVLGELGSKGATIIIIEHNKDLIEACDYVIELGPSGGHRGGKIVRQGFVSRTNI